MIHWHIRPLFVYQFTYTAKGNLNFKKTYSSARMGGTQNLISNKVGYTLIVFSILQVFCECEKHTTMYQITTLHFSFFI